MKLYQLVAFCLLLFACHNEEKKKLNVAAADSMLTQPGIAQKNSCLNSLGKHWSVLRSDCVELSEMALSLEPTQGVNHEPAYLIFNADYSQAELFLPAMNQSLVLQLADHKLWKKDSLELKQAKGYELYKKGVLIFKN